MLEEFQHLPRTAARSTRKYYFNFFVANMSTRKLVYRRVNNPQKNVSSHPLCPLPAHNPACQVFNKKNNIGSTDATQNDPPKQRVTLHK